MNHFEYPPQAISPEQPAPAPQLDLEHLAQTAARFGDRIDQGITEAAAEQREITRETARLICHVLGRAFGRQSALANFARTGDGSYDDLRPEYLDLYVHPGISRQVQHWIDWLGTHLIQAARKEEHYE